MYVLRYWQGETEANENPQNMLVDKMRCCLAEVVASSSTKDSVSKDIPVRKIQSAGIVQYKRFSQQGHSSTKYAVSRDSCTRVRPLPWLRSMGFQF